MKDSPERDLAVANELGRMADARIRELETERREFQTLIRMCLQQFEFQYGKRERGWDAKFLIDRCEAVLDVNVRETVEQTLPELDSDNDYELVSEAVNTARRVQDFIWNGAYPDLRPYDAEGWRALFQKRVDCIAEADLTRRSGLALLRKRLLQQAALSIKALALLNRWARRYPIHSA